MPIGKGDLTKHLQTPMRIEFLKAMDNYVGDKSWQNFTMTVPSTTDTESYGWLGQLPAMREFIGERQIRDLTESGFTLQNKTWEMTIGVKRAALEDDKLGSINMKIQGMADNYMDWLAEQAYKALLYGDTTLAGGNEFGNCYLGTAAYTTTNNLGGGAIDNIGTTALAADAVKAEYAIMMGYKGDQGKYLNVQPTHIVLAPDVLFVGRELVTPPPNGGGVSSGHSLYGLLQPLTHSCWSADKDANTNTWALVDCSKRIKPIIYQQRTELEFTIQDTESYGGFMRDEVAFGVRVRCAFGYGAFWLANLQQVA